MTSEQERTAGPAPQPVLTVAAVARRLGVAPSTLRTWDRRYGLGPSAHTAGSHRRYGPDDLHRLTVMRGLTLEGVPPAEAAQIALSSAARDGDAPATTAPEPDRLADGVDVHVDLMDADGLAGEGDDPHPHGPDAVGPGPLDPMAAAAVPVPAELGPLFGGRLFGLAGPVGVLGPATLPGAARPFPVTVEPGRGSAVWITGESLPGAPRAVPAAEALVAPAAAPGPGGRAGGGRVVSLPDASPRTRGLARAAMALDTFELGRLLREAIGAHGVVGAWESMIVPVLQGLGERWRATGEGVDVEHAFCEAVMATLREAAVAVRRPLNVVPVLLACAEGDQHSLPLHVVAAALAEEQVGCRMLGSGVPSAALVAAVRRTGPAVVLVYARLPVAGVAVLRELPRQRPAPRVLVGGPGWDDVALPAPTTRVASLTETLSAVLRAARL